MFLMHIAVKRRWIILSCLSGKALEVEMGRGVFYEGHSQVTPVGGEDSKHLQVEKSI